jgi:transposase
MKLHRNAKSTPSTRLIMVQRVLREGWSYADAAEGFAVSVRTVAKWVGRFRDGGLAALEDASSRPGRPPHQTPAETVTAIRAWRETYWIPAWRISRAVGVPTSTVGAWLRRLGLNRPPVVAGPPVQRYEWPRPGDLVHLISSRSGAFARSATVSMAMQQASPGAGWSTPTWRSTITAGRLCRSLSGAGRRALRHLPAARAIAWFTARGITCHRLLTDNGSGYVSRAFRDACAARAAPADAAVRRARTARPSAHPDPAARVGLRAAARHCRHDEALRPWLRTQPPRPHASLRYQPPITRLQSAA